MPAINAAYLEFRLSGGAANTNPNASLGGVKSTEVVASQSATFTMAGVAALFAAGNPEGNGTLTFTAAGPTLAWTPLGGTIGPAVTVSADGRYALFGGGDVGVLAVNVTFASLPVIDGTAAVTIANVLNELYDDVSPTDSFNGDTEYRCYYLHNAHPTDQFISIICFIGANPNPGTVAIGPDAAGAGNGTTTGVATTVANENTVPAGVTFNTGNTEGTGVIVGQLLAGESRAVWVKRIVPPLNAISNPESVALFNATVFY